MNSRLINVIAAVSAVLAFAALNCRHAEATARATATPLWSHVKANAVWGNTAGHETDNAEWTCPNHPDPPCEAYASKGVAPNTRSRAHALAWRGQWPAVIVASFLKAAPGDWAHGKAFDSLTVWDTVSCSIRYASGTTYWLRAKGVIRVFPNQAPTPADWADIQVRVYENGVEGSSFLGGITLTGYGSSPRGDFVGWTLQQTFPGDGSRQLAFDDSVTFSYSGVQDSLVLDLMAANRAANVPTVTQWGLAVLICLMIGSAVFIMVRRRKKTPVFG